MPKPNTGIHISIGTEVRFTKDNAIRQGKVTKVFRNGKLQVRVLVPDPNAIGFVKPKLYSVHLNDVTFL